MNTSMEVALLHKLLKQTTAAYEEKLSELTTSQQAFQESESRLNTILDTIDAYVYVKDRQGRYLYVNEITRKLWGVDNDHVIGNTDEAFFDAKTAKSIKANDRLILDQGQTIRSEERNRVRGGLESRVYLSTKMPLLNANGDVEALLGVSTDITERVQAEEQLRIAALVYDNSDEAIIVTDADNQVIAINPAFTAITGYTESEVVGRPISQFDPLIDPPGFYADLGTRLDENGAWKGQIWHKVENNVRLALLVSVNTVHDRKGHIEKRVALYSDITEKTISEEAIWHHANYDELTHLPNRRLFFELLERQIKAAHRAKAKFALMFLDLDHFKEINDTLGHLAGDELLRSTAQRIRDCVRETDIVARLGGDEFVVVLTDAHTDANVRRAADAILEALRAPFEIQEQPVFSSTSIGITLFPNDADNAADLLKNADQAMYASKHDGRSRYRYFEPRMQKAAREKMDIGNELRDALNQHQFTLVYQPIVELASGQINKAEALLRWTHPLLGPVPPHKFIPLAEELSLIDDIGQWVFDTVAAQVQHWRRDFAPNFQINVNKSPVEFRDNSGNVPRCLTQLAMHDVPADGVVIEITEGTLLNMDKTVSRRLLGFRDAGVQVAIDDFGTGYSSLAYLQKLDIDYLKIDRRFISNLTPLSTDLALAEAIVVMAHRLGLKVVAEGVETAIQAELLTAMGCDYAQGFHFAHPMPAEDFERAVFNTRPGHASA